MSKKDSAWTVEDSAEVYGIRDWGNGYFDISSKGEVMVNLRDGKKTKPVSAWRTSCAGCGNAARSSRC